MKDNKKNRRQICGFMFCVLFWCGIVTNYRTFREDFNKLVDFYENVF